MTEEITKLSLQPLHFIQSSLDDSRINVTIVKQIHTHGYLVQGPHGRIYVQHWKPESETPESKIPIILFHESLGCAAHWRDLPALLSHQTRREVIAYDRLGFGRSDPFPGTLPLSFIQDEVKETFAVVKAARNIKNFIGFGHSVGGAMAVAIAATHPETCHGIVTIAALSMIESQTIQGVQHAKAFFSQPDQLARLAQYHGDKAKWVLSAWVDTWLSAPFHDWNMDPLLTQVRCPALVIHGAKDEYASTQHAQRIATQLGGPVTLHVMTEAGHFPHRTHATEVINLVQSFFQFNPEPKPTRSSRAIQRD